MPNATAPRGAALFRSPSAHGTGLRLLPSRGRSPSTARLGERGGRGGGDERAGPCHTDGDGVVGPTDGVDLNRNYEVAWGGVASCGLAPSLQGSTDGSCDTYIGTAPFSEPGTQVVRDFGNDKRFAR